MAQEVLVILAVVIPDEPPESRAKIRDLRGRELPGVPGSWVTRVAVHAPHPSVAAAASAAGVWTRPDYDAAASPAAGTGSGAGTETGGLTADELEHELDRDCGVDADDS